MRALLVEDDPAIAEFVARGLREAGFAVDEAADSERALTTLSVEPYDAAVTHLRDYFARLLDEGSDWSARPRRKPRRRMSKT